MTELTKGNTESWFETIWDALHGYREDSIPEDHEAYDEQWSDICTAMAWLREEFDEDHPAQHADRDVLSDIVHYSIGHHESQLRFLKRHHELEEAKENRRLDSLKAFQKSLDL
jgi:hypothetical protein